MEQRNFYMMNKDNTAARITIIEDELNSKISLYDQKEKLPIGVEAEKIGLWLENRKASKHNPHLKTLMAACGCDTTTGFIQMTHAASLNDTFWIRGENEKISWSQVSFYRNPFNEAVSRAAFEGIGLDKEKFSGAVPELSTEGRFRKCWARESDEIYLYKRGRDGGIHPGSEPYGEALASELAAKICSSFVEYELEKFHGTVTSKCELFTNEDTGYVSLRRCDKRSVRWNPDDMLSFYKKLGCEEQLREMVVVDALTFNVDRHLGNFGVLFDNDTLQFQTIAPCFDLNLSLLPYLTDAELEDKNKIAEYKPLIGTDFSKIANGLLTLISLKGYEFSFRGDEKFSEARVKRLEVLVEEQVNVILHGKTRRIAVNGLEKPDKRVKK